MLCLCLGNVECERRYPIGIELQYVCKITKKKPKGLVRAVKNGYLCLELETLILDNLNKRKL